MKKSSLFLLLLLLLPVVTACPNLTTTFVEGRYRDSTITGFNLSCNGSLPSSCSYHVNDFANVSFNCSNPSLQAELGWNRATLCGSNGTAWNCTNVTFWAKSLSANNSSDYAVIIITLIISILVFLVGMFINNKGFLVLACFGGLVLGYECLAFSMPAGTSIIICSLLLGLKVAMGGEQK